MAAKVNRLDASYVTGFVDGEGCFTYSRSGPRLAMYFAVKLTRADRPLLEALQRFFGGVGVIYDIGPREPGNRSGLTKAASYYRVCRREDLKRIVAHFDAHPPRGSKGPSYRIWREMVLLKRQRAHPPARLDALAKQLSAASPRNGPWSREGLQRSRSGTRQRRNETASASELLLSPPVERDHPPTGPGDGQGPFEP